MDIQLGKSVFSGRIAPTDHQDSSTPQKVSIKKLRGYCAWIGQELCDEAREFKTLKI